MDINNAFSKIIAIIITFLFLWDYYDSQKSWVQLYYSVFSEADGWCLGPLAIEIK